VPASLDIFHAYIFSAPSGDSRPRRLRMDALSDSLSFQLYLLRLLRLTPDLFPFFFSARSLFRTSTRQFSPVVMPPSGDSPPSLCSSNIGLYVLSRPPPSLFTVLPVCQEISLPNLSPHNILCSYRVVMVFFPLPPFVQSYLMVESPLPSLFRPYMGGLS